MSNLQKIQEEAVALYRKCASIPNISSGTMSINNDILSIYSIWSQRNLVGNNKRTFSRKFHYPYNSNSSNIDYQKCFKDNFPTQTDNEQMCCESKSGQLRAILRKIPADKKKKEDTQNIEIWSNGSCIKCYTFDRVLDKHGKINHDDLFGCFTWSPCERYLLYIAEKKVPEACSFFDTKKDEKTEDKVEKGRKFVYQEDWGEQLVGIHMTVLVVLDTEKDEIRILDGIPENICAGQAIWAPDGNGVIFCGQHHKPYRLGLKYCHNRKSGIYYLSLDGKSCEILSDGTESVCFPRLSPDESKLIYVSRMLYGPHLCCKKILMYDWQSKTTRTLVDQVDEPENESAFPGLFTGGMVKRVWSDDGSMIVLDTARRSTKDIVVIDAITGSVQRVTPGNGCWTLLDVHKDFILASYSSPATPA
ncbi:acylamino-acid-releasing enzyme-like, partial [Dendronephthya gigantea]|uniref:acylamino-acid-releasing enzyme-like n=1 Tax=Dendronephthya gigantea TaxID=151771 RepID=UPI00106B77C6